MLGEKVNFKKLLYFECDEETLKNRIKIRAKDSGRSDDNDESLLKRLKTYNESTKPIIGILFKIFFKQSILIH